MKTNYKLYNSYNYSSKSNLNKFADFISTPLRTSLGGKNISVNKEKTSPNTAIRLLNAAVSWIILPIGLLGLMGLAIKKMAGDEANWNKINKVAHANLSDGIVPQQDPSSKFKPLLSSPYSYVLPDFSVNTLNQTDKTTSALKFARGKVADLDCILRYGKPFLFFQDKLGPKSSYYTEEVLEKLPVEYTYYDVHHTARFETVNFALKKFEKLFEEHNKGQINWVIIARTPGNSKVSQTAPTNLNDPPHVKIITLRYIPSSGTQVSLKVEDNENEIDSLSPKKELFQ